MVYPNRGGRAESSGLTETAWAFRRYFPPKDIAGAAKAAVTSLYRQRDKIAQQTDAAQAVR